MKNKAEIFETKFADNYQASMFERLIQQLEVNRKEVILDLCPKKSNTIVDLACGDGELLWRLKNRSRNLIGLDISSKRLKNARIKLKKIAKKLKLKKIDLDNQLDLKTESVDLVICEASLQYFVRPQSIISETKRILKPSGLFVLQIPNISFLPNRIRLLFGKLPKTSSFPGFWDGGALHYFNHAKIKYVLEELGFKILEIKNSGILAKFRRLWPSLLAPDIIIKARKK